MQYGRPISDISRSSVFNTSGGTTTLYTHIDETTAVESDYIYCTGIVPSAGTYLCKLTNGLTDPQSSSNHIVSYRVARTSGTDIYTLTVKLWQGTTLIASWTNTGGLGYTAATTVQRTLTSGEANSISDYTALRLEFIFDFEEFLGP